MKFQRTNPYNKFLPYAKGLEEDADKYWAELRASLKQLLTENRPTVNLVALGQWLTNSQKYMALYGLRISQEDHVFLVKTLYGLLFVPNVDPVTLDKLTKTLVPILKKKYLLANTGLLLEWRPLFDLYYRFEGSSAATRGLLKAPAGLLSNIRSVVKFSRSWFSEDATQEMLDLWRPKLCPFDRAINAGFKYLSLFLPTTNSLAPEKGWKLWFDEFMTLWSSFTNSPSWEVELFQLYGRLAFHNIGRIDWSPLVEPLFTKFMVSFCLPVTYGGSGIKIKFGLSEVSSYPYICRWMVSAMGGPEGRLVQAHLDKMLLAIESYYQPANMNSASEGLHSFISTLTSCFMHRVHLERYNNKWECKTPFDKRLTDENIDHFVKSLLRIAFQMLYNPYDEDRKTTFNILATLRPNLVLPPLLDKLHDATETLTEPHRLTACIATLSACSRPFVEHYPLDVLRVLEVLLPGLNINDIWKSTDIFILMSDLLEMIWIVDFSHPTNRRSDTITEEEEELLAKTSMFEDFVVTFTGHCLTLLENSSREQVGHDADAMDETLNDEEIAADAAITETFHKMVGRCSAKIFNLVFDKLKRYTQSTILEPAVAGAIFASMCKGCVAVQPEVTLEFFVPYLTQRIETILIDRGYDGTGTGGSKGRKADQELMYLLLLLFEVVNVRMLSVIPQPSPSLIKNMDKIFSVLDKTLSLQLHDEYLYAASVLENLIFNLVHVRPIQKLTSYDETQWSRESFHWGKSQKLDELQVTWYIPGKVELDMARGLLDRYLLPSLETLTKWTAKEIELEKEEVLRDLRRIYKIISGCSEVLPTIKSKPSFMSVLSSSVSMMDELSLTFNGGKHVRETVLGVMELVQKYLLETTPDDTDSLNAVVNAYDVLMFSFGLDESELNDHIDEHRTIKAHRLNKLVSNKEHLETIHIDRIAIQHETHLWLKNFLVEETLPTNMLDNVFELSVSQYSDVRATAQTLLMKILTRVVPYSQDVVVPKIAACLRDSPENSHQKFKGALYMMCLETYGFFYSWKYANILMPAIVEAQHSDKQSIVDLLKEYSIRCNKTYTDFNLYTLPVRRPVIPDEFLKSIGFLGGQVNGFKSDGNNVKEVENEDFLKLEKRLCDLLRSGKLHWRHSQMAIGMLLSLMVEDHVPPKFIVELWLDCLLNDERKIRLMSLQAIECVLKICKVKKQRQHVDYPAKTPPGYPGARPDNEWMQYNSAMTEAELEAYWQRPFCVKPEMGFYEWQKPKLTLRVPDDTTLTEPAYVRDLFMAFFNDEAKVAKYVELNTVEFKKGEDYFNMDRSLFHNSLVEAFGPGMFKIFLPHLKRLCASSEEHEQRLAAEIIYGLIRGARFWSYAPTKELWSELMPLFETAFGNMTIETISDWETCLSGGTNNADPNRLRWLFELLVNRDTLLVLQDGAFKESSALKLINRSLIQNWKARELLNRTFEILKNNLAHPFNNVRTQTSRMLATLLSMDIDYKGRQWNMGNGYPTRRGLLEWVIPKLSLNFHNPVLNGTTVNNHVAVEHESSTSSNEELSMEVDDDGGQQEAVGKTDSVDGSSSVDKEGDKMLETVANWVSQFIQISSTSLGGEVYQLLPYFCQFVGNETAHEVSQACLKSLCFLSVCIVPADAIPVALDMSWKVAQSKSWKAKISILEFVQTFAFTNFMQMCRHDKYVKQTEALIVSLMSDDSLQVRTKATKILTGLFHSQFINVDGQKRLLKDFRTKIRKKMTRKAKQQKNNYQTPNGNGSKKTVYHKAQVSAQDKTQLAEYHSGILGLTALTEAYPYDVPEFLPDILVELAKHLHDPMPIPKTIKDMFAEFKRTHQDKWQEHKLKFTDDQLYVLTDLLISPNYYA